MFTVVEETYFDAEIITVECQSCVNDIHVDEYFGKTNKFQNLFLKDGKLLTHCVMCGEGEGNQETILNLPENCSHCNTEITIRHIRENIPCPECKEVTNKVVATTRYKSRPRYISK